MLVPTNGTDLTQTNAAGIIHVCPETAHCRLSCIYNIVINRLNVGDRMLRALIRLNMTLLFVLESRGLSVRCVLFRHNDYIPVACFMLHLLVILSVISQLIIEIFLFQINGFNDLFSVSPATSKDVILLLVHGSPKLPHFTWRYQLLRTNHLIDVSNLLFPKITWLDCLQPVSHFSSRALQDIF